MVLLAVAGTATTCPAEEARLLSEVKSAATGPAPSVASVVEEARLKYGVEIVVEGQTWDEASLDAVMAALESLPSQVLHSLGNPAYGPLRILSNPGAATLSGTRPYAQGANFYYNTDGRNEIVLMPSQGTLTVLHEMGHAYQMRGVPAGRYAWVYLDSEMGDFIVATGWRLLSYDDDVKASWDGTDLLFRYDGPPVWKYLSRQEPAEDFANAFAYFFYDPAALATFSPARYDWFLRHAAMEGWQPGP